MRPAMTLFATSAVLMVAALPAPALAQELDSWVAGSFGPDGSRQCMAMAAGQPEGDVLIARVGELGVIEFRFTSDRLRFVIGQSLTAELLVDGRTVELAEVTPVNPQTVQLIGAAEGRLEGSILRAIEQGKRAVVQLAGIRGTFSLEGSQQSIQLLSQCAMNGGRMPATDALAFNSAPPEPSPPEVEAYADYVGEVVGDWNVYPSAPHIEGGCFATRMNDEGSAFLLHQERPQASVSFGIGAEWFNLSNGWKGQTALVIDDQSFPFLNIRALDKATLLSAETSDPVAVIDALRRGQTAEFSYQGKTYSFDLDGFAAMVPAFAKCVAANDKTYASVRIGNLVNRALGVTLRSGNQTLSAEAADVEEEDNPATGSGSSMAALLDRPRAYAQLRCSIPLIHLVGLYGAQAQPFELDISVNGDATAIVQGTTITPVEHSTSTGSPGPSIAIYQASEIFGAANKSPLPGIVGNAPRPPQGAFEEGFSGMIANPGSMVPENRLLGVSLENNDVTIADQLPGGGFGDMTSHRCRRIR